MSRRRRGGRARSQGNATGIALGVALMLVSVSAFAGLSYLYLTKEKIPRLDASSLCPIDGPKGITVVLIDTSDDLPRATKDEALIIVKNIVRSLPDYYRLDIKGLDIPGVKSRSIFSKCNPGSGAGLSEWTASPELAKERWRKSFEQPAIAAIENSLSEVKANSSPIMAAIQDIAIQDFTGAVATNVPKELVIISDMIESTGEYSQYPGKGDLSYERFQRSKAYLKFRTDLRGANLDIRYVTRANVKLDAVGHPAFWKKWATDNMSGSVRIVRLQGT